MGTIFPREEKAEQIFDEILKNPRACDRLKNTFLIPIRFNDKGVENPILLTDENGKFFDESELRLWEKKYKMFRKLFEQQNEIPDYKMYMADGFRENHFYSDEGEIETRKVSEHRGILLMFNFPESVEFEINEEKIYAIVWEALMRLQEALPRALMYYGKRDENGVEKHTSTLGIFLPFCHFEREMEKTIELANGIGLGCREAILVEMKAQTK